jgi:hypothetical protein
MFAEAATGTESVVRRIPTVKNLEIDLDQRRAKCGVNQGDRLTSAGCKFYIVGDSV